jgi:hypothetical protein
MVLTRGENLWFPDFMATRVSGEWAVLGGELTLENSEGVVGGEKVSKRAGTNVAAAQRRENRWPSHNHSGHVL